MDFRAELAKWGYNKGNSIDVEILINEVLPKLFSQQERMYSEDEVKEIIKLSCEEGMLIQRTINDKVKIPYWRIKDFTIRIFEQFKKKETK
jgi:hypothetical protein